MRKLALHPSRRQQSPPQQQQQQMQQPPLPQQQQQQHQKLWMLTPQITLHLPIQQLCLQHSPQGAVQHQLTQQQSLILCLMQLLLLRCRYLWSLLQMQQTGRMMVRQQMLKTPLLPCPKVH
jgi:hypothetical protein